MPLSTQKRSFPIHLEVDAEIPAETRPQFNMRFANHDDLEALRTELTSISESNVTVSEIVARLAKLFGEWCVGAVNMPADFDPKAKNYLTVSEIFEALRYTIAGAMNAEHTLKASLISERAKAAKPASPPAA